MWLTLTGPAEPVDLSIARLVAEVGAWEQRASAEARFELGLPLETLGVLPG